MTVIRLSQKTEKMNPNEFNAGQIIISVYTLDLYKVICPGKAGMSKLLNLQTNFVETWNAENNRHFALPKLKQLDLWSE